MCLTGITLRERLLIITLRLINSGNVRGVRGVRVIFQILEINLQKSPLKIAEVFRKNLV